MKHRIFVETIEPSIEVTGEEFHHAARVARVREGEEVEIFDGRGHAAHGKVVEIGRDTLRVEIDREIDSRESPLHITLAPAIIQLDKFELVLQKATELGVAAIVPLVTDRVEVRPERYRGKSERWKKIIFEAVKQCGRAKIPDLEQPATFDMVVTRDGTKILFDADAPTTEDRGPRTEDPVTLLIGPEGGWSSRELDMARKAACVFRRLGRRRLRAETAALVAIVTVAARSGELD